MGSCGSKPKPPAAQPSSPPGSKPPNCQKQRDKYSEKRTEENEKPTKTIINKDYFKENNQTSEL